MKLCVLVIIGVNERGEKHFLAIEDGVRESTQSWREVLWTRSAGATREAAGGLLWTTGPPPQTGLCFTSSGLVLLRPYGRRPIYR
jgi:hypothetical protein